MKVRVRVQVGVWVGVGFRVRVRVGFQVRDRGRVRVRSPLLGRVIGVRTHVKLVGRLEVHLHWVKVRVRVRG